MEGNGWNNREGQAIHPMSWKNVFNAAYAAARHNQREYEAKFVNHPPTQKPKRREANI